ncbi:hypothetical protein DDD_1153 [Nonlabens dokdonensis DSW-6]|uniref:Uncharacterized protein n=1 Tax=Nonlabens dokdonensis (strain DSM 17205 / KCTC 12402 / DSW-6) TaxID=592029 RepID=L7W3X1_NONDD|nr:hypothetical protein DDD_1153 [Nonlabens dokdonensis DSW-6]
MTEPQNHRTTEPQNHRTTEPQQFNWSKSYLIILFAGIFIFNSCERDVIATHSHSVTEDQEKFTEVTFNKFKSEISENNLKDLAISKQSNTSQLANYQMVNKTTTTDYVTNIDSTKVVMATVNDVTSFTFATQTINSSEIINYVVAQDEDFRIVEFYLTYKSDGKGYMIDPATGNDILGGSLWCPLTNTIEVCADCGATTCDFDVYGSVILETSTIYELCASGATGGYNPPPGDGTANGDGEGSGGAASGTELDEDIITLPVVEELAPVSTNTQALFNSLNDTTSSNYNLDLYHFIQNPQQNQLRDNINIYLRSEYNSQEAQGFSIQAIIASKEGGEVDFENKSIYGETVPDCLKDIINSFKPSQNGYTLDFTNLDQSLLDALNLPGDILSSFDNDEGYAVKIVVEPNLVNDDGDPLNATTGQASLGNMSIITFNANYLNRATDLAIARTAIHELVHAYLQYIIQHVPNSELGESLDVLILQSNLGVLNGDPQHVLMAEQFVNAMALSLGNDDGFQHAAIEYQRLAWSGGMFASNAYAQLDPLEQPKIISRNFVEEGISMPNTDFPLLGTKTCL